MKVGCGGFMVARGRYFETLPTVEIGAALISPPAPATAATWRAEAPKDFEFSLPVSQVVTHQSASPTYDKIRAKIPERRRAFCGHFKDTPEVRLAWEATQAAAAALKAKFVVFETPSTFYPDASHLKDMYRFFKQLRRGPWIHVWAPRGPWEQKLRKKVAADLGLVLAKDPLEEPDAEGSPYYRLRGSGYNDTQLSILRKLLRSGGYLYFTHRSGWLEAKRLVEVRR